MREPLPASGFRLSAIGYPLSTASLGLINQLVVPQTQKREAADRHYLYADRYLSKNVSLTAHTKILRLRVRMTMGSGRLSRNADFILIAAKRRYHHPLNPLNPLNPGRSAAPYFPYSLFSQEQAGNLKEFYFFAKMVLLSVREVRNVLT